MRTIGATETEIKDAKESIVNQFIFIFDKPLSLLKQKMIVDYYGMPDNYLESYREKIMAVTVNDVLVASKKRLKPDKLQIVVFGDPVVIGESLSKFGETAFIKLNH
jgi:predicted Zn-dependent peptidase